MTASSQHHTTNRKSANPLMSGLGTVLISRICKQEALLCEYQKLPKWYRTVQCLPPVPVHPVGMQKKSYSTYHTSVEI
jgi:hypothetical protein